jgi:hypothetical protein
MENMFLCIYIYIERERERERGGEGEVNHTLEQTTKAQRGSKRAALLFL